MPGTKSRSSSEAEARAPKGRQQNVVYKLMSTPAVDLRNVIKGFPESRNGHAVGHTVRAMDDISLRVEEGEFFALLGPSGCGKTTTLRTVAGFESPDSGEILIRGQPMRGVPSFHRPVNTVFQDYALFPHMSVLQNVLFGLKMAKVPKAEARKRAEAALALVQLPQVETRKPSQLSGGQRQRVALARALVNEPAVLLLDEPLGALDLKLRKTMQFELKSMQRRIGITFVFVTHDQEEAMTMADRIAVMDGGKILQIGTPREIYEHPVNRFVADFIGDTNFLEGTLLETIGDRGRVKLVQGSVVSAPFTHHTPMPGEVATVAIRPERIRLEATAPPPGSELFDKDTTRLPAIVTQIHYLGTDTRYTLEAGPIMMSVRQQNLGGGLTERFEIGQAVVASWHTADASLVR